jgi:hypothetical protein
LEADEEEKKKKKDERRTSKVERRKEDSSLRVETRSIDRLIHPVMIQCQMFASPKSFCGRSLLWKREAIHRELQESSSRKNEEVPSRGGVSQAVICRISNSAEKESRVAFYLLLRRNDSRKGRRKRMRVRWRRGDDERRERERSDTWMISERPPFDAHPVVFAAKQSSRACASDEKIFRRKVVGERRRTGRKIVGLMANVIIAALFLRLSIAAGGKKKEDRSGNQDADDDRRSKDEDHDARGKTM